MAAKPLRKEDMTRWLTLDEVLAHVGKTSNTLNRWILAGTFPKPHYFGLTRRWSAQEVEDWCQNTPTDSRDVPHNAVAGRAGRARSRADAAA